MIDELDAPLMGMEDFFDMRSADYEEFHLGAICGGAATKKLVADALDDGTETIADLGCGTGLELEHIFRRFPEAKVTGIDLSGKMLQKLKARFADKNIELIHASYFDYDFGTERFDAIVSVMSLHHFSADEKAALYSRLHASLKRGGCFVLNDYFSLDREQEKFFADSFEQQKQIQNVPDGIYHYDIPMFFEHEVELIKQAGFSSAEIVDRQGTTITIKAIKEK